MAEFHTTESLGPAESGSGSEQVSEQAKERYAASQAAGRRSQQRDEGRAKKRDAQVARAIMHFLSNDAHTHLFLLVSRLVARDCPSIFIVSILSLIDAPSQVIVDEFLTLAHIALPRTETTSSEEPEKDDVRRALLEWTTRMQAVMSTEAERILPTLIVPHAADHQIEGTVLQLTRYILEEFFASRDKMVPKDELGTTAIGMLRTVFEPFMDRLPKLSASPREDTDDGASWNA